MDEIQDVFIKKLWGMDKDEPNMSITCVIQHLDIPTSSMLYLIAEVIHAGVHKPFRQLLRPELLAGRIDVVHAKVGQKLAHVRLIEEGLEVGDVVEAEVVVGDEGGLRSVALPRDRHWAPQRLDDLFRVGIVLREPNNETALSKIIYKKASRCIFVNEVSWWLLTLWKMSFAFAVVETSVGKWRSAN